MANLGAISLDVINKVCSGFAGRLSLFLEAQGQSISKLLRLCRAEGTADVWRPENQIRGEWTATEDCMIHEVVPQTRNALASRGEIASRPHWICNKKSMGSSFPETRTWVAWRHHDDDGYSSPIGEWAGHCRDLRRDVELNPASQVLIVGAELSHVISVTARPSVHQSGLKIVKCHKSDFETIWSH
jgi:hypothetical protein